MKNKVTIITGASKGVGKAISKKMINKKAKVIIVDIDKENGIKTEKELGENCEFINADITKEDEIIRLKNYVMDKYKKIDILINNAAKQTENSFFNMEVDEFKEVIDTNLNGTFICSKILGNEMKRGSKILNVLSVHYDQPRKNKYHYDASKAGVAILTKEMALDVIDRGITVNAISFGACETSLNADWLDNKEKVEDTLSKIPMRYIAKPEYIADFAVNILENFAQYTTGSIFNIDGGRSLRN